ncbi:hypothetical protein [Synechococcus sp.]|uniref:hypothetical protein n=1 Tax=Synechococcus sp. TaxID=1131 RepID=UPI0034A51F78
MNQIGYVALNANEEFDTLTYELVRDRGTILLANLESSDTPNVTGMKFQRDINLINGQKLVFFEVVDTTLESLLAKNTTLQGFGTSFRTLDLSKSTDTAATASKGGNTVALSLLNESAIAGLGDLISSQMADTPILDFTGLAGSHASRVRLFPSPGRPTTTPPSASTASSGPMALCSIPSQTP